MKIVKPLVKFVGKYAAKLAPIAAFIPGFGPAIAGGLLVAGKIAKTMQKFGVATSGKKGSVRRLKFQNPKAIPAFKAALEREAQGEVQEHKRNPRAYKARLKTFQSKMRAA